jgi:hypothetical protein
MKLCDSRKHFIPNLSKPVTAAYSGETENANFEFFGLTYKRRTKCWSLRLDISAMAIYVILFECEIIIRDFIFRAFNILAKKAKIKYPPK